MQYQKVDAGYSSRVCDKYARSGFRSVPFVMAFCRTLHNGNMLIVGDDVAVTEKIKGLGPTLAVTSIWKHGRARFTYCRLYNVPGCYQIHKTQYYDGQRLLRRKRPVHVLRGPDYSTIAEWRRVPSTFPRVLREILER